MFGPKYLTLYLAFTTLGVGIGLEWRAAELERHRAADASAAVNIYRLALQQYGSDWNGSFPRLEDLPKAVLGGGLPDNPWSQRPNGEPMKLYRGPWPGALNGVGPVARGEVTLSPVGTDLGPGHYPGDGPDDHLTYGTLYYAYEPNHQIFVIYVVGKRGNRAVVLGAAANAGG